MTSTHLHEARSDGEDLLHQQQIRDSVKAAYRRVVGVASSAACRFYADEELALLPGGAVAQSLGVGNPVRVAGLRESEVVIDLGCGGGIDTLLAARMVAPTGTAIGLDVLDEMLERARQHAAQMQIANAEWLRGEIEAIPRADESVDVALSNGVINVSPRKSRAFAEIYRILRPGGRFAIADLLVDDDLPPEVLTHPGAWAG